MLGGSWGILGKRCGFFVGLIGIWRVNWVGVEGVAEVGWSVFYGSFFLTSWVV